MDVFENNSIIAYIIIFIVIVILLLRFNEYLWYDTDITIITRKLNDRIQLLDLFKMDKIQIPIFYINLDRSIDRNESILSSLRKNNIINYHRISAVDGNRLYNENFINKFYWLHNNEVGCTLSHLKAINLAWMLGLQYVLIVEDDISFDIMQLWDFNILELIQNIKIDWQILKLITSSKCRDNIAGDFKKINYSRCHKTNCWSTAAYIINREGMRQIVDKTVYGSQTYYIGPHIDNNYMNCFVGTADDYIFCKVNTVLCLNPCLLHVVPGYDSNIGTGHIENEYIERTIPTLKYWLENEG